MSLLKLYNKRNYNIVQMYIGIANTVLSNDLRSE